MNHTFIRMQDQVFLLLFNCRKTNHCKINTFFGALKKILKKLISNDKNYFTNPFYSSVHRDAYVAVSLRRTNHLGQVYNGVGVGRLRLARRDRGQTFAGHLVYAGLPRREPVQWRGGGFVGFVPRQFLPAGRVDLCVVVRDVRFDAHRFRCKTRSITVCIVNIIKKKKKKNVTNDLYTLQRVQIKYYMTQAYYTVTKMFMVKTSRKCVKCPRTFQKSQKHFFP